MKKLNIRIVGCGYIGKKVARKLIEHGVKVKCYVHRQFSKTECESLGFNTYVLELDDTDFSKDWRAVEENSVVAFFVPPPRQGLTDTRMTNFISALERTHVLPNKIVLISTTGVYGNCHGQWIDETQKVNPQADRAHRRLSAEMQLQKFCQQKHIECIVFRVPGIYAMDKLPVRRISSGEAIVCEKDSGFSNRIHADDLVAFCVEALTHKVEQGIYNCCDGNPSTMYDYFMRVADTLKLTRPKEISLQQAQVELSEAMLSYLLESKRISNKKLRDNFTTTFKYKDLESSLRSDS